MKNYKQTIENGRFELADNGFSADLLSRLASMPERPAVMLAPRLSAWYEFRLPMIGAAVGILLFGLIVTNIVDFSSWVEKYVDRTELFASKLTQRDQLINITPAQQTDENNQ